MKCERDNNNDKKTPNMIHTGDGFSQLCGGDGELVGESSQPRLSGGAVEAIVRSPRPPRPPFVAAAPGGVADLLVRLSWEGKQCRE